MPPESRTIEWVIDTNILYLASDYTDNRSWAAVGFFRSVQRGHKVALDHQKAIFSEYERCFQDKNNEFQRQWWQVIIKAGKIAKYNNRLSDKHRRVLLGTLNFHQADLPFIGVAAKTPNKLLVTEDSHYTDAVRQYVRDKMSVCVIGAETAESKSLQAEKTG